MPPTSGKGDTVQAHPYLDFNGRCEEAIEFYRRALGAEVTGIHRFKDAPPDPQMCAAAADKIMHATLRIGENTLMASDGHCTGSPSFQGFSLAINTPNLDEAEKVFTALSDGGQVQMPLAKTFFSPGFGMLSDRFGVNWMVHVTQ
jgi:PhnB protein